MQAQIHPMILQDKLAISVGKMTEKLSGASDVTEEDTVTVASQLGGYKHFE